MIKLTQNQNGVWFLVTDTYSGASRNLELLLKDAGLHSESILIEKVAA